MFFISLKSFFCSQDNQIIEFKMFKFNGIIKCLSIKQKTHFTELNNLGRKQSVNEILPVYVS